MAQGAAIVLHGISPWGKRPFAISFFSAAGARGTCHLLGVTYDASVRFDSPSPGQAPPMMKNWIIAALAVALALSIAGVVVAQTQRTATVEVRIFENVRDPSVHYIASRPRGGPWTATERLSPLYNGFVQGGRYRFRDVFVNATVPQPSPPASSWSASPARATSTPTGRTASCGAPSATARTRPSRRS